MPTSQGSFVSISINDNTIKGNGEPESASIELPVIQIPDTADPSATLVIIDDLVTAIMNMTIGIKAKTNITMFRTLFSTAAASSIAAQRENKFLCRYHGVVLNKKFRASIPTADLTHLMAHSEFVDLTSGVGQALKTKWELAVVSPDDNSEATVLDSVQFVGRNS